jgi:hypothetical protein
MWKAEKKKQGAKNHLQVKTPNISSILRGKFLNSQAIKTHISQMRSK